MELNRIFLQECLLSFIDGILQVASSTASVRRREKISVQQEQQQQMMTHLPLHKALTT